MTVCKLHYVLYLCISAILYITADIQNLLANNISASEIYGLGSCIVQVRGAGEPLNVQDLSLKLKSPLCRSTRHVVSNFLISQL